MDVSDVAVNDRPGYLILSMTINPTEGYRITSDPIQNCSFDSLFAAAKLATMNLGEQLRSIRPGAPWKGDKVGFDRESWEPGSPVVSDNLCVIESVQEITYQLVINSAEAAEERVLQSPQHHGMGLGSLENQSAQFIGALDGRV